MLADAWQLQVVGARHCVLCYGAVVQCERGLLAAAMGRVATNRVQTLVGPSVPSPSASSIPLSSLV